MNLTQDDIERLEAMYARMTSREMADELGYSHAHMRQILSRNCISDPMREERERTNGLLRRFWGNGEPRTIAEYLGLSINALRMRARRMGLSLTANQTKLPL